MVFQKIKIEIVGLGGESFLKEREKSTKGARLNSVETGKEIIWQAKHLDFGFGEAFELGEGQKFVLPEKTIDSGSVDKFFDFGKLGFDEGKGVEENQGFGSRKKRGAVEKLADQLRGNFLVFQAENFVIGMRRKGLVEGGAAVKKIIAVENSEH